MQIFQEIRITWQLNDADAWAGVEEISGNRPASYNCIDPAASMLSKTPSNSPPTSLALPQPLTHLSPSTAKLHIYIAAYILCSFMMDANGQISAGHISSPCPITSSTSDAALRPSPPPFTLAHPVSAAASSSQPLQPYHTWIGGPAMSQLPYHYTPAPVYVAESATPLEPCVQPSIIVPHLQHPREQEQPLAYNSRVHYGMRVQADGTIIHESAHQPRVLDSSMPVEHCSSAVTLQSAVTQMATQQVHYLHQPAHSPWDALPYEHPHQPVMIGSQYEHRPQRPLHQGYYPAGAFGAQQQERKQMRATHVRISRILCRSQLLITYRHVKHAV